MNSAFSQMGNTIRSMMNRRTLTILSIAFVLIALPLTVYIGQQRQDIRQRASLAIQGYAPAGACSSQNFSDTATAQNAPDIALAVSCLNQAMYNYCVVRGNGTTLSPNDNLTRGEYIAFIVRYHSYVIPPGHPQHWDIMSDAEIAALPAFNNSGQTQFKFIDADLSNPSNPAGRNSLYREIYTSQKYNFIRGYGDGTFQANNTWNYGFHGITRNDRGADPNYNDSFNNPYNFAAESGPIKRGEFISQLYQYGKDPARSINGQLQLAACFQPIPTDTPIPQAPTATPTTVPASGGVSQNANCSNALSDVPSSLTEAMGCYHNTTANGYCVVRGNGTTLNPNDNLSRAEYVAFIVRYHNQVFPVGNANHWDLITRAEYDALDGTTGKKKFPDVNPNTYPLWQEIYTSQKYGFIVGQLDGNFYPNDLWTFGFHGITRDDQWPTGTGYNFTAAGNPISRGTFIQQLFDYGKAKSQLTACFPTTYTISGVVSGNTGATNMVWNLPNGATPPVPFQTDASGNYDIRNLSAGTYLVSVVSATGKTADPLSYTVTVGPGCTITPALNSSCGADGNASKVNFKINTTTSSGYTISGVVTGVPAGTTVNARPGGNAGVAPITTQTDASGTYTFRNLPLNVTYNISVSLPTGSTQTSSPVTYMVGFGSGTVACSIIPSDTQASCAGTEASKINFAITNPPTSYKLAGKVTGVNRTVTVTASPTSENPTLQTLTAQTSADGSYSMTASAAGYYFVTVGFGVSEHSTPSGHYVDLGTECAAVDTTNRGCDNGSFYNVNFVIEPNGSVSQAPSISPTQPHLNLEVIFRQHGIGLAADNANPNATPLVVSGTIMPLPTPVDLFKNRAVTVYLSTGTSLNDGTPRYEYQMTGTASYASDNSGFYKGVIDLGTNIPAGQYIVAVRTSNSLSQQATGFVTISPTNTVIVNVPPLVSGNVYDSTIDNSSPTNDNQLDILDYNAIMDHWLNPDLCTTSTNQLACETIRARADLNADGMVDVRDYNLFIRELSVQRGR